MQHRDSDGYGRMLLMFRDVAFLSGIMLCSLERLSDLAQAVAWRTCSATCQFSLSLCVMISRQVNTKNLIVYLLPKLNWGGLEIR